MNEEQQPGYPAQPPSPDEAATSGSHDAGQHAGMLNSIGAVQRQAQASEQLVKSLAIDVAKASADAKKAANDAGDAAAKAKQAVDAADRNNTETERLQTRLEQVSSLTVLGFWVLIFMVAAMIFSAVLFEIQTVRDSSKAESVTVTVTPAPTPALTTEPNKNPSAAPKS